MNKIILSIETTTNICSVALFNNKKLISIEENFDRKHSILLAPFVNKLFKDANIEISNLDAIALSIGPGSYTGLRIGLSFAKGMAFSLTKPIIPINTIETLHDSINESNYFIIVHAYKDYFFIQEYRNGKAFNDIIFDTIDIISSKAIVYGYSGGKINRDIIEIFPSSLKVANVAYANYNKYICHNIKSIKPNYIKPIQFKKKMS